VSDREPSVSEAYQPGDRVEVRSRFDRSWSRGFSVEHADADGYRLRRRSDGSILPAVFPAEDLRPERRRQGLWWA
jgi:hypothetical protein